MRALRLGLPLVVLLGLVVRLPVLAWGFLADDHGHQLVLSGAGEHPSMRPWSLYDFGTVPPPGERDFELGAFPWWTDPDWRVRFLRPVASASLMLDHALFGGYAPGYHLSGLALFAALCVVAHALYRALGLAPKLALLATAVLAVEDGSVFPVGWIANRNTLVEALFVALACLAVARPARTSAASAAAAVAAGCLAAFSKESGVVALALVAAGLALRGRAAELPRERRAACAGAACAALAAAGFLALFFGLGYGARSLFYPTPWGAPQVVLANAALLAAAAPLALAGPFAPDALAQRPELAAALVPPAAAVALALVAGALLLARRSPRAGLLAAAALLALLPQAGAPISDRLLCVPALFAAPLIALAFSTWRGRGGARRAAAWTLLALALPLSALACLARSAMVAGAADALRRVVLEAEVGDAGEGPRDALVLNAPSELATLVPITTWLVENGDAGVRFWPLQMGRRAVAWTRTGEREFELEALDGPGFGAGTIERVFQTAASLDPERQAGRRFTTALFDVEVLEGSAGGGARRARFSLPAALESPRYRFLAWRDGRLRRVPPPAVGERVVIPGPKPLYPLLP